MKFNKTILAALALFAVILSATAVSAIDGGGDVIGVDKYADSTDGEDPVDVSDSVNLSNSLDIDDEDFDLGDNPYHHGAKMPNEKAMDEEATEANAAGENNDAKISVGSTATGNPLIVLLAAMTLAGTGLIRNRK